MATNRQLQKSYEANRPERTEPHIPLSALRAALGFTVDQLLDRIEEETGKRPTRGTISLIEHGKRGASAQMLAALELAYGLPEGAITTDYVPIARGDAHDAAA